MGKARTILGDVDAGDLGIVDAHEHLIRTGGLEILKNGEPWRLNDVDKAIAETKLFAAAGGKTIVDMNPVSAGRDIRMLLEVAKAVPEVHIIVTTGFHEGRIYDEVTHWTATYTVNQIADLLIAEVEEGIDIYDYMGPIVERSTAKAGCIKVGTAYSKITPVEEKNIEAVAIAAKETGACINTHTAGGTMALEQAERFIKYGVKPERIMIGHVQRNPDVWYHKKLPETDHARHRCGSARLPEILGRRRWHRLRSGSVCTAAARRRPAGGRDRRHLDQQSRENLHD